MRANQKMLGKPRISFVIANDFPEGNTKNARIKAYAQGLKQLGWEIHIYVGFSSKFNSNKSNTHKKGIWKTIPFSFLAPNTNYPKLKLLQFWHWLIANTRLTLICLTRPKEYFVFYTPVWKGLFTAFFISSLFHKKLIILQTEKFSEGALGFKKRIALFEEKRLAKKSIAILTVSSHLTKYFKSLTNVEKVLNIAPVVTDLNRFEVNNCSGQKCLGYMGTYSAKDGVNIIVNAFSKMHETIPHLKLRLMGKGSHEWVEKGIESIGQFAYSELSFHLNKCDCLIVNRVPDGFSTFGFPIKLAEYLATGTPVLLCDFAEYRKYLDDTDVIYFKANDEFALMQAIKWRYENYELANNIGLNGRVICEEKFSMDVAANELNYIFDGLSR